MIAIQNLGFSYSPKQKLFNGLSLQLQRGHIYGLLGKNGAGKSTLLKNMVGLAFPKSGICTINNIGVSGRPASVLADLFFLPEDVYVPSLTPLAFGKRTGGFYPGFDLVQYTDHLKGLDIDQNVRMDKMSFGQQKKAMIAFGLATNTSLLVLDEPTNGLDIPSKVQFRKLIAAALTEDKCIIISTHQVRDLDSLIDTVLLLNDGDIAVNMAIDDIARQLTFATATDTAATDVLYEEESVRGKKTILRNTTGQYNRIDLELLFNAVVTNGEQISKLLKQAKHEPAI